MTDYETPEANGGDPAESLQEYKRHAENVAKLEQVLEQVDGIADSMTAKYDDETELGQIRLYLEFYDTEEE